MIKEITVFGKTPFEGLYEQSSDFSRRGGSDVISQEISDQESSILITTPNQR